MVVAMYGYSNAVRLLCELNVDVNAFDRLRKNALRHANESHHADCVCLLLIVSAIKELEVTKPNNSTPGFFKGAQDPKSVQQSATQLLHKAKKADSKTFENYIKAIIIKPKITLPWMTEQQCDALSLNETVWTINGISLRRLLLITHTNNATTVCSNSNISQLIAIEILKNITETKGYDKEIDGELIEKYAGLLEKTGKSESF